MPVKPRPAIDRILERTVESPSGCWVFQGGGNGAGYGTVRRTGGGHLFTHRATYEYFIAEIPDGLVIDHLCRNRKCCNPWHLDPVTHQVNLLRGVGRTAINASRTHCPQGHPYDEENTIHSKRGDRGCRTCKIVRLRNYRKTGRALYDASLDPTKVPVPGVGRRAA